MKIAKVETLKADAGWRDFSFLKLTTDDGLVGWSEYNEDFGASNATTELIARFAELAVGMDPREVGKIAVSLRAHHPHVDRRRQPRSDRGDRERLPRRQGEGARRAGL